ncbi:hypothetical protein ZWY2020_031741 [Hordeum vulgare]|nr:hypothetical protein ZWY2020_031741 [Hordeum vulgare]
MTIQAKPHWSNLPLVTKQTIAELMQLIQSRDVDRSRYTYQVNEIRMILAHERNISLAKISRHADAASHTLYLYRTRATRNCLLANEIASILKSESNHLI